tara:strand:- start:868 stop:3699 length:2832 start_codon:yes stop_codon:yes gene_type:complete
MALTKTQVSELYVAIFNRASEGSGNSYWQGLDLSAAATASAMLETPDAQAYFGGTLDDNQAFIEQIYANTLNKTAEDDPEGIAYWVDLLESGMSRGQVASELVNAVAQYENSDDPATAEAYAQFTNRVAVSDFTADNLEEAPEDYQTSLNFGADLTVTADDSTVADAEQAVEDIANPGETFSLTASATPDTIIGTSGSDTINAAAGTVQAGDQVIDQSTTDNDTLNISSDGNVAAIDVRKIENINIDIQSSLATHSVDAANIADGTITVTRSDLADGAIQGGDAVVINNVDGGSVKVVASEGVDDLTVSMDEEGGSVDAGEASTVSVDAFGNAGAVELNAESATDISVDDITVDGVSIVAGAMEATDTGISLNGNASDEDISATVTASGVVNLNVVAGDDDLDALTLAGNGAEVNYVVSTGAVVADYTVTGEQDVTLTIDADDVAGETVTNELTSGSLTVDLDAAAGGAVDLSDVDADTLRFSAAIADSVTVNSGTELDIAFAQAGNLVLAASDSAAEDNSVAINVSDNDADADTTLEDGDINVSLGAAVLTDFADVSLSADASEVTSVTATSVLATGATLSLTGDVDFALGSVAAEAVNAAAVTGDVSLTMADVTDAAVTDVTTGEGDDIIVANDDTAVSTVNAGNGDNIITITAAAQGSSFVTGTGEDSVTVTEADAVLVNTGAGDDTVTTTAVTDSVLNGGAGADTLELFAGVYSAQTNFAFSNFETVDVSNGASTISNAQFNGQSFTLVGDAAADVLTIADTTGEDATIDASGISFDIAAPAAVALEGGAGDDSIVGTSNSDTITGGAGVDSLAGGSGADTFVFASGDTGITAATADTITDFATGTDTLQTGFAGAEATIADGSGYADFAAFVAAAEANFALTATAGDDVFVAWNAAGTGDAWVAVDQDGSDTFNADDSLVILTGVNAASEIATADFIV